MGEKIRVIVTGEHDLTESSLTLSDGRTVEWIELNLLRHERLNVEKEFLESVAAKPFQWIIFTSPRSVQFWTETLLEHGLDFPVETQVACIGEKTAEVAGDQGYTPDFYPTEAGSETFIEEFKELLSNHLSEESKRPRVLIVQAANGRTLLKEKLEEWGCAVTVLPLYKTLPVESAPTGLLDSDLENASLVLFTSPSSVDAFQRHFRMPKRTRVGAIGKFTFDYLLRSGIPADLLPGGEFRRVGEILC